MKVLPFFTVFFLVLWSCNNPSIEITPAEMEIMKAEASYFGGEVSVKKKLFFTSSQDNSENTYKITLKCNDLKKNFASAALPASHCAWSFYSQMPEDMRNTFDHYMVELPFDNQQKTVEFSRADLETVMEAKPQLDSVTNYFISGDYLTMQKQFLPEVPRDKAFAEFQKEIEKLDAQYGRTKEVKIRSFEILEFKHDSISEDMVRFHVLQVRDKAKVKFSATVSLNAFSGFIGGLLFEG